ncbi:DNA-3-methyladenine glycosylase 2 family protein [Ectothiorhodospiraceae bacterium WFHF3C12]|nr:DNA-3-methyladenine glycosylase 2 family protein [Ectothiorhodospiraceae bacterium WFHF3C12]
MLDTRVCERARCARDARFDGRFYTGVVTTGVYCRPVCPAASRARPENVRYFVSAAAASAAGYRPCLRCRPETAPGQPRTGTERAVARALELIETGHLAECGIGALAGAVGLSERQLHRAFTRDLGVSPKAYADHQRLQFARQLLAETTLPVTDVAMAAGFGSLRRFNDAFRTAFDLPPGRLRGGGGQHPGNGVRLRLAYRPPLDWAAAMAFRKSRAVPGVEYVDGLTYRRSIVAGERPGWIEISPSRPGNALRASIHHPEPRQLRAIVARIRFQFDLDVNMDAVHADLGRDPLLAGLLAGAPGLRLPCAWAPFELAVRAVLGQQVSVKAATTLAGRLVERFGAPLEDAPRGVSRMFPTAGALATADLDGIGLTGRRARTLRALAAAVADDPALLDAAPSAEAFAERLCALPGIGPWTAAYVAMRGHGEPDAFPAADLGLMKALAARRSREVEARAEAWRPWRAYAAIHLWHSLG